jgi:hypothetical protein
VPAKKFQIPDALATPLVQAKSTSIIVYTPHFTLTLSLVQAQNKTFEQLENEFVLLITINQFVALPPSGVPCMYD